MLDELVITHITYEKEYDGTIVPYTRIFRIEVDHERVEELLTSLFDHQHVIHTEKLVAEGNAK